MFVGCNEPIRETPCPISWTRVSRFTARSPRPRRRGGSLRVRGHQPVFAGCSQDCSPAHGRRSGTQPPADDWRREKNKQFQEPWFSRNLRLVAVLRGIGDQHGKSPGEVAWTLRQPAVTGAIVGARKTGQLRQLASAADWRLAVQEAFAHCPLELPQKRLRSQLVARMGLNQFLT